MVSYYDIFSFISESNSKRDFTSRLSCINITLISELGLRLDDDDVNFDFQVAQIIDELIDETKPFIENTNSINFIENQPTIPEDFVLRVIACHNHTLVEIWEYQTRVINN